jgi:NAD(P)H dehydrogenase (quinone)
MARLHRANRYDRATHDVEEILGRPASGVADYITMNPELFPR